MNMTLGGTMKTNQNKATRYGLAVLGFLAMAALSTPAKAYTSIGLNLSYGNGGYANPLWGNAGVMGVGSSCSGMASAGMGYPGLMSNQGGGCATCFANGYNQGLQQGVALGQQSMLGMNGLNGMNNGFNNGMNGINPGFPGMGMQGMNPGFQLPALPPPPQQAFVPPHIAAQNQMWGPANASMAYPGQMASVGPGMMAPNCVPCSAGVGYQQQAMMPVAGGPLLMGASGGASNYWDYATAAANQGVILVGGAPEQDDTASIVMATGIGLGMQTTNVYPVAYPRYEPTNIGPMLYGSGDRNFSGALRINLSH